MTIKRSITRALGLALALAAPAVLGQAAYPAKGQSEAQQSKDVGECRNWATKNTGFDPKTSPPQYNAPQKSQGGALRGAAKGAAFGAIVGGDAGKGAAVGGVFGGARQAHSNSNNEAAARANHDQAMSHYNQQRGEHERAQAACLESRGYTVR